MRIDIGISTAGKVMALPLRLANRHGLVTGATGTGKTVTLQRLAEEFSRAGVPVFAADVKGDLSGIAAAGDPAGAAAARANALGRSWSPSSFPVAFWDVFGQAGLPIRTSVQDMGAQLLSRMLGLNPAQEGAMEICFRKAEDEQAWMLSLDDLRWSLNDMLEEREDVSRRYGNITASSIAAIQRGILALEAQGGHSLFGEPPFEIEDFMRADEQGRGFINLLHADRLMEAPKLYATFLLWLLTELFRKLPEAGDLDKPKLVFFFDEAHLLFTDAPKHLVQLIERLVRLVRSKGVGVYFVTQSPTDVPPAVLEQLGTKIVHAMRAHTASSLRKIKAAAESLRPNREFKARDVIPVLGLGEALVSIIEEDNVPTIAERVRILPPAGQIGPISDVERLLSVAQPLYRKYQAGARAEEEAYRFTRRMKAKRGIDAGPDTGPQEYTPGLYLKHVPSIDISQEATGKSVRRRLFEIAFWGAVTAGGLKLAGLI